MGGAAHEICADAVVGQSAAGAKIKRRVSTFASVRAIPSGTIEQVDERLRSDQHGAVRPTGAMFPPLLTVWPNASLEALVGQLNTCLHRTPIATSVIVMRPVRLTST
jgi:hypothetical protein